MHKPSNIIISIVGFLIAFGAVGTIEVDPTANLLQMTVIAIAGLCLMYVGINALTMENK